MKEYPVIHITPRQAKLIDEISSLRERITNSKINVAWKPSLQHEAVIRSAMGSTAIEGYVLSLPEVEALSHKKVSGAEFSKTEKAVFNYLSALKFIQKSANAELSDAFICQLHSIVTKGMLKNEYCGHYRSIQNYIVSGTGQVVYTPPKPQEVPKLMADFITWINTTSKEHLPAISSALIHYKFVSVHPFIDGNGRVARLLGTWELLRRDFDTQHIFAIDDIIYEHKLTYYSALQSVRASNGNVTGWLDYYLEIIAESLERAWKRISSLPKSNKAKESLSLTPKQEKVIKLLNNGRLSAKELAAALVVSVQGVHFILQPLIKAKIVKRFGGRKTGKFGINN